AHSWYVESATARSALMLVASTIPAAASSPPTITSSSECAIITNTRRAASSDAPATSSHHAGVATVLQNAFAWSSAIWDISRSIGDLGAALKPRRSSHDDMRRLARPE